MFAKLLIRLVLLFLETKLILVVNNFISNFYPAIVIFIFIFWICNSKTFITLHSHYLQMFNIYFYCLVIATTNIVVIVIFNLLLSLAKLFINKMLILKLRVPLNVIYFYLDLRRQAKSFYNYISENSSAL